MTTQIHTHTISLSSELERFLQEQIRSGRFKSEDEAIGAALSRYMAWEEQKRRGWAEMEARVKDALSTDEEPQEMTKERWDAIRERVFGAQGA